MFAKQTTAPRNKVLPTFRPVTPIPLYWIKELETKYADTYLHYQRKLFEVHKDIEVHRRQSKYYIYVDRATTQQ